MDESNATYLKTQEELKSVRTKQDEDMRKRDRFISAMLDCSSQLKQKSIKLKGRECLSEIDLSISKFMELAPPDAVSTELRDHCLDLYQRVVISHLKASIKAEDLSKKKIDELTDQHASLANEHKREKDRADHLTDDYAKFRQEHFTTVA